MADITNISGDLNAGTIFAFSNGAASQTFEYDMKDEKLVVLIRNDDANEATVTLTAGDFIQSGYGDIAVAVTDTNPLAVVELESGVVKDADGEVTVTVTDADGSEFTGTEANVKIAVIELE